MAFADWIPTIINVGSSLFGGGGSSAPSAPSAPSSSGIDWGSILQGVGQLASRVEMVPGAGALDEDIRKANRFNLLAGLLGGGSQIAGGLMAQQRKAGMLQDVSDILSGKQTTTGQAIEPAFAGTTATPTATPTPTEAPAVQTPQSQVSAIWGLANKYPEASGELFKLGQSVQEAQAKSAQAEQERQATALTGLANVLTRPNATNLPAAVIGGLARGAGAQIDPQQISENLAKKAEQEAYDKARLTESQIRRSEAQARASEGRIPLYEEQAQLYSAKREALPQEQQRKEQSFLNSALNIELQNNQRDISNIDEQINRLRQLPTSDPTQIAQIEGQIESLYNERDARSNRNGAIIKQLQAPFQKSLSLQPQQLGGALVPENIQNEADTLAAFGATPQEIESFRRQTQQATGQPTQIAAAQPTETPQPEPSALPTPTAKERASALTSGMQSRMGVNRIQKAKDREVLKSKVAPEAAPITARAGQATLMYETIKNAMESKNPAMVNDAVTKLIQAQDFTAVHDADRKAFMRGVVTPLDEWKRTFYGAFGIQTDLPQRAKKQILELASKSAATYKQQGKYVELIKEKLVEDRLSDPPINNTYFDYYYYGDPKTGLLDVATATKMGVPVGTRIEGR